MKKIIFLLFLIFANLVCAKDYSDCSLSVAFKGKTDYPVMLSGITRQQLSKRLYDLMVPNLDSPLDYTININYHGLKIQDDGLKVVIVDFDLLNSQREIVHSQTRRVVPRKLSENKITNLIHSESTVAIKNLFYHVPACSDIGTHW